MMFAKNCGVALVLAVSALGLGACSASSSSDTSADDVQGGVPVTSKKFDAVGSLVAEIPGYPPQPFCTATLISDRLVLTAKHCAMEPASLSEDGQDHYYIDQFKVSFSIGSDAVKGRMIQAESAQVAALMDGGIGYGADVAVYRLSEAVTDVTPIEVSSAPLTESDVGNSYFAIGFGVRDAAGNAGVRTAGNITMTLRKGAPYHVAYATYEAFKAWIEERIGRPVTQEEEAIVHEMYDQELLDQYEAFFSPKDGDVQVCSGDSGRPAPSEGRRQDEDLRRRELGAEQVGDERALLARTDLRDVRSVGPRAPRGFEDQPLRRRDGRGSLRRRRGCPLRDAERGRTDRHEDQVRRARSHVRGRRRQGLLRRRCALIAP
jgi:hypothetical protein